VQQRKIRTVFSLLALDDRFHSVVREIRDPIIETSRANRERTSPLNCILRAHLHKKCEGDGTVAVINERSRSHVIGGVVTGKLGRSAILQTICMQTAITSDLIYSLSVRQFICYGGINRDSLSLSLSLSLCRERARGVGTTAKNK